MPGFAVQMLALGVNLWIVGCGVQQESGTSSPGAGAAASSDWAISDTEREAMLNVLVDGESHPVWFATDVRDRGAQQYQAELADVFAQAGWEVRGNRPTPFPMKPGIYFFTADAEPPDYVVSVQAAFEAAGIEVVGGSGYRAYYEEMKQKDPEWQGFVFAEDQTFLVVVGRRLGRGDI